MAIIKRILRYFSGRRVEAKGSITFSISLLSTVNWEQGVGNNKYNQLMKKKRQQLQQALLGLDDRISFFLHVEIDECQGLAKSDYGKSGVSDPFVVVKLNGVEFARTKYVENSQNPKFVDEAWEVSVPSSLLNNSDQPPILTFHVWDWDVDGCGDFLGEAVFNLVNNDIELLSHAKAHTVDEDMMMSTVTLKLEESLTESTYINVPSYTSAVDSTLHKVKPAKRAVARHVDNGEIEKSHRTDTLIEGAVQDVESSTSIIYACIIAIIIYLVITYTFVTYVLDDSFSSDAARPSTLDTVYFAVVTFTTVGYGDFYPETNMGRIFAIVHTFSGIALVGSGFTIILNTLVKKELAQIEKSEQAAVDKLQDQVLEGVGEGVESEREAGRSRTQTSANVKGVLKHTESTALDTGDDDDTIAKQKEILESEDAADKRRSRFSVLCMWVVCILLLAAGGAVVGHYENWGWIEAFYWTMVTSTSVGYGDYSPETVVGRSICIVFIPFAVGLMGASIGQTVSHVLESRAIDQSSKMFEQDFALEDFINMTKSTTGDVGEDMTPESITREEFLVFMLLMMKKCDKPLLNRLNRQFDRMDKNGDQSLDWKDLEILEIQNNARRRLRMIQSQAKNSDFTGLSKKYRAVAGTFDVDADGHKENREIVTKRIRRLSESLSAGDGSFSVSEEDLEMALVSEIPLSPPHKDLEDGLYFFDACTPEQVNSKRRA
jgi:hypothetical protein